MFASQNTGLKYVDRGDVTGYDFTAGDFTKDDEWHTLSLADIVPVGTKIVHIAVGLCGDTLQAFGYFRNSAFNNDYNVLKFRLQGVGIRLMGDGFVTLDANRSLKYQLSDITWSRIDLVVRGWVV